MCPLSPQKGILDITSYPLDIVLFIEIKTILSSNLKAIFLHFWH